MCVYYTHILTQDILARGSLRFDSTALPPGRDGGWSVLTFDQTRRAAALTVSDGDGGGGGGGGEAALWSAGDGPAGPVRLALVIPFECTATFAGDGEGPTPDRQANLQARRTDRHRACPSVCPSVPCVRACACMRVRVGGWVGVQNPVTAGV